MAAVPSRALRLNGLMEGLAAHGLRGTCADGRGPPVRPLRGLPLARKGSAARALRSLARALSAAHRQPRRAACRLLYASLRACVYCTSSVACLLSVACYNCPCGCVGCLLRAACRVFHRLCCMSQAYSVQSFAVLHNMLLAARRSLRTTTAATNHDAACCILSVGACCSGCADGWRRPRARPQAHPDQWYTPIPALTHRIRLPCVLTRAVRTHARRRALEVHGTTARRSHGCTQIVL
jgi:hypothetical protein